MNAAPDQAPTKVRGIAASRFVVESGLIVERIAPERLKSAHSPAPSGRPWVFPQLHQFTDLALVLLRLLVAIVFVNSGWSTLKDPARRAKDLGFGRPFTVFLGVAEVLGGLGVLFGILIQLAAAGLILINLGAVHRKSLVWRTGFWGEAMAGWSYDLFFIAMNLVILTTAGGRFVVWG
jgi:putative oxidoreductase